MNRFLVSVAAATVMCAAVPVGVTVAAELAAGTVSEFDQSICAFKLRSGAVFYQNEDGDQCEVLSVGDRVLVSFAVVDGRNDVSFVRRYEDSYALGSVASIVGKMLTLTTGADFDLTKISDPVMVAVGDLVRVEFIRSLDGQNIAIGLQLANSEQYE